MTTKAEKAAEQKAIDYYLGRYTEMEESYSKDKLRFEAAEKLLDVHITEPKKLKSMFSFMAVRTYKNMIRAPAFNVLSSKPESVFASHLISSALAAHFDSRNIKKIATQMATDQATYGVAYIQMIVTKNDFDGETNIVYKHLSPIDVLLDENYLEFLSETGFGDCVDCIIPMTMSYNSFKAQVERDPGSYINIDDVKPGYIYAGSKKLQQIKGTDIEVWYCYSRLTKNYTLIAGSNMTRINKDDKLPTRIGKIPVLPIFQFIYERTADSSRNSFQGIPDLVRADEELASYGMILAAETMLDATSKQYFIDMGVGMPKDIEERIEKKKKIIPYTRSGLNNSSNPVVAIDSQPVGADYYNLIQNSIPDNVVSKVGLDFKRLSREEKHASTGLLRDNFIDTGAKKSMEENESGAWRYLVLATVYAMIDYYSEDKWRELIGSNKFAELKDVSKKMDISIKQYLERSLQNIDISIESGSSISPNRSAQIQEKKDILQYLQPGTPENRVVAKNLATLVNPKVKEELAEAKREIAAEQQMVQATQGGRGAAPTSDKAGNISDPKAQTIQQAVQGAIPSLLKSGIKNKSGQ